MRWVRAYELLVGFRTAANERHLMRRTEFSVSVGAVFSQRTLDV